MEDSSLSDLRILSLGEVAALASVSLSTIRRFADDGDLVVRKVGRRKVGVFVKDFRTWMDGLGLKVPAKPAATAQQQAD